MTKIRIYELAKELSMNSKDLIEKTSDLDLDITSHMSTINDEEAELIKELLEDEGNKSEETNEKEEKNVLQIGDSIVVKDLAEKIGISSSQLITKLIGLGIMVNQNQEIDFDTASIVVDEFNISIEPIEEVDKIVEDEFEQFNLDYKDNEKDLKSRPPVVTVMGHVDHGKTSLLDAIRKTQVTKKEAGGITQHIGASIVSNNDKKIVFLDTPGHEAFTAMRARGTQVTDIAILVVAADDGVMPQTVEAINHAKAANVPIIVAINKMDKPEASPDRIKQELTEYSLVPEDWGGDTICVPVSALRNEGIDELMEMVLLVAEMEELKANPSRKAVGTIIDAQLDKGKGPVATVLVQKGTLKVGDMVVSGSAFGRVRAMFNDNGERVKT
ncbi:MAG TPA: translation initiation factor IF-2, partial [Tissierellales bacterium]|nr:translation initiation factor IF-2 [Tissierellales bacterium]